MAFQATLYVRSQPRRDQQQRFDGTPGVREGTGFGWRGELRGRLRYALEGTATWLELG